MRQEVTITEAATAYQVDRSTIMRICIVAKDVLAVTEGALAALAASTPVVAVLQTRDYELSSEARKVGRFRSPRGCHLPRGNHSN